MPDPVTAWDTPPISDPNWLAAAVMVFDGFWVGSTSIRPFDESQPLISKTTPGTTVRSAKMAHTWLMPLPVAKIWEGSGFDQEFVGGQ